MTIKETPELVKLAQKGDRKAQTVLVELYSGRIYNLGLRMLRNVQDAEDLLQEAYIIAFKKLHTFKGNSTFYTWIYRIAVNIALGKLREQSKLQVSYSIQEPDFEAIHGHHFSDWPEFIERKISGVEFQKVLKYAMDELSEKYRSVFVLRDLEGLSTTETAEALDLTESNVKVRLMRARLSLRDRMNDIFKREGWLL